MNSGKGENVLRKEQLKRGEMRQIDEPHQSNHRVCQINICCGYRLRVEISIQIGYERDAQREEEKRLSPVYDLQQQQKDDHKDHELHQG